MRLLLGGLVFGGLGLVAAVVLGAILGSPLTGHFLSAFLIVFAGTMIFRVVLNIHFMLRRQARRHRMRRS